MDEKQRYEEGLKIRKAVLGEEHVARTQAAESSFNSAFQNLITRYAWGEIWKRPGLDRKTRSLITVGILVALNRPEELRLHLRAAKNNGVSDDEIREVLLHSAIYCGVPAANSAFHLAEELLDPSAP